VKQTAVNFKIGEVSADKAYLSVENVETVYQLGGTPFIAFKENSTGAAGGLFQKMFRFYSMNREEYMAHYHKRSNVESVFSMVKAKFGDGVKSETPTAMINEALCKLLCHNLCCLILSHLELGIEPIFWNEQAEVVQPEPIKEVVDVVPVEVPAANVEADPVRRYCACAGA